MNTTEGLAAEDASPEELAQQALSVVDEHAKIPNPSTRTSQYWRFDFCACGWKGYPHADHVQLMMAKWVLRVNGVVPVGQR